MNKKKRSTITTFILHCIIIPSHGNMKRKKIRRKGIKLSLYADHMTLYLENPNNATKKTAELIYELNKVSRYKTNIQKSVVFLYINNKILEREHFCFYLFYLLTFFSFVSLPFLGLLLWQMEVPRLGIQLEPQPPAYARATASWEPSHVQLMAMLDP